MKQMGGALQPVLVSRLTTIVGYYLGIHLNLLRCPQLRNVLSCRTSSSSTTTILLGSLLVGFGLLIPFCLFLRLILLL
jgi:hypothetical protein